MPCLDCIFLDVLQKNYCSNLIYVRKKGDRKMSLRKRSNFCLKNCCSNKASRQGIEMFRKKVKIKHQCRLYVQPIHQNALQHLLMASNDKSQLYISYYQSTIACQVYFGCIIGYSIYALYEPNLKVASCFKQFFNDKGPLIIACSFQEFPNRLTLQFTIKAQKMKLPFSYFWILGFLFLALIQFHLVV